ncbi:hypothetical protein [Streptomyces sp. NPDC015125]|uniref:hypothetical protein n=1 Tax=Streptomyces sp. NPDC015125 TaxID=3364938 RepID=UPI0036FED0D6
MAVTDVPGFVHRWWTGNLDPGVEEPNAVAGAYLEAMTAVFVGFTAAAEDLLLLRSDVSRSNRP